MLDHVQQARQDLAQVSALVKHPKTLIQDQRLRIDDLTSKMIGIVSLDIQNTRHGLERIVDKLMSMSPAPVIEKYNILLEQNYQNILKSFIKNISNLKHELQERTSRLQALDPTSVLNRGYSIVRTVPDQKVVSGQDMVALGDDLEVLLAKGKLLCTVKGKSTHG